MTNSALLHERDGEPGSEVEDLLQSVEESIRQACILRWRALLLSCSEMGRSGFGFLSLATTLLSDVQGREVHELQTQRQEFILQEIIEVLSHQSNRRKKE